MATVQEMHAAAQRILFGAARRVLLGRGLGCTIIVHDAKLEARTYNLAVATTLPTRRHQRVVMAAALAGMAERDGHTMDDAAELAINDIEALEAGELDKEDS